MASSPSAEIHTTPSDLKIVYYDKAHRYKLAMGDEPLRFVPSVSTILDKSLPKNLSSWAERIGVEGVFTLAQRGRPVYAMGPDAILDEMKAHGLRYYQRRDDAADRGTAVHTAFESLAGGVIPALRDFPVEHRGYVQAMCRWWQEFCPEVIHTELMVGSWTHQYAGRMDLLANVGGVVAVIDLKTSKAIRESHHFQTAGYRLAVEESGYPAPGFGAILRVDASGEFEYVHSHATADQFLALHKSHLAQKEFEKAGKEAAKAALKEAA